MFSVTYNPVYLSSFEKDVKKVDPPLKKKIKDAVYEVLKNPASANELTGELKGFSSYHFKFNRVDYRVAFRIDGKDIVFIKFGKRENFYDELKRRI
jgi:mRNA interferase RelE/StbE